jgi:flagellar assembly factor FliW
MFKPSKLVLIKLRAPLMMNKEAVIAKEVACADYNIKKNPIYKNNNNKYKYKPVLL